MDPGVVLLMNLRYHQRSLSTVKNLILALTRGVSALPPSVVGLARISDLAVEAIRTSSASTTTQVCSNPFQSNVVWASEFHLYCKLCRLVTRERAAFAAKLGRVSVPPSARHYTVVL
jgi:hypothetical protein